MTTVACVGIAVMDFVFGVDQLPSGDGKMYASRYQEVGGGVAANAAFAVSRLGGSARFLGRLGDDRLGALIIEDLGAAGVDTSGVAIATDVGTPVSAVLVDASGERLIVNHTPPELFDNDSPALGAHLEGVDAVLVDVRWPSGAETALRFAEERGIPSVFDFDRPMDSAGDRLLTASSHVAFSAAALATTSGTQDPSTGLDRMAERTDAWLAVTLGAGGVLWRQKGMVRHLPAFEVATVDTVGAGDIFHGALALAIGEGMDEADAVRFSSAAAAIKCSRRGARSGAPTREEVEKLLMEVG